jgi:hypothetical protein
MFGRFFQGRQDKLVDSSYDVCHEDIDWVIKHKVEFELKNIAFLLAFEHLRPLFLLWQVGKRKDLIKVKSLSQRRSLMISPNEI